MVKSCFQLFLWHTSHLNSEHFDGALVGIKNPSPMTTHHQSNEKQEILPGAILMNLPK